MKNFHPAFFFVLLLLTAGRLAAQTNTAQDSAVKPASYWQAELTYTSNNVYLGRKDSLRLPYLSPAIGYYHSSGLYISGGLSYLAAPGNNRVDLTYFDGGYIFSSGNFQAQLSGTKYFYSKQSTNVKADVKAGIDLYAAYDAGFIQPSLEASANFSNSTDYILTLATEHSFYATDQLSITPSIALNAGTQKAYNSYYSQRRFAAGRKKLRNASIDIMADVAGAAAFKVLDYECSVPVSYKLHRVTFSVAPYLALPVNPATIHYTVKSAAGVQRSTTYNEKLDNTFYWTAGIALAF